MSFQFKVVIPARYESTRLPGKPLLEIAGVPLIQHVYNAASDSNASDVLVATDNDRISQACKNFGANVVMTSAHHKSGTDRISEAISILDEPDDSIIVNVQADEYALPAELINQVAGALYLHENISICTLCERITSLDDYENPNVVKVIFDSDQSAISFSRSPLPWFNHANTEFETIQAYRHIGIYAYRAGFLKIYPSLQQCELEKCENLEQLRALFYGYKIHIEQVTVNAGIGVDTEADLRRARQLNE